MLGGGLGFGLSLKLFGSGNVGYTYLFGSPYYDPPVEKWYNTKDPLGLP